MATRSPRPSWRFGFQYNRAVNRASQVLTSFGIALGVMAVLTSPPVAGGLRSRAIRVGLWRRALSRGTLGPAAGGRLKPGSVVRVHPRENG